MGDLSNDDDDRRFFGGRCLFPLLLILIAIIVAIALVIVISLFIIIPKDPILTVTNASLNQFNFTPATNALDYNLALNLSFRNPNKRAGISYREIQVIGAYRYEKFANVKLNSTPFYQDHKNTTALPTLLLQGQKLVRFMKWDVSKYNSQTAAGVYRIDLKIRLRLRYNRVKLIKRIKRWPVICCNMEIPLNRLNGTSAGGFTAMCKRNHRRNRCL